MQKIAKENKREKNKESLAGVDELCLVPRCFIMVFLNTIKSGQFFHF